jgi:hypothetical protein
MACGRDVMSTLLTHFFILVKKPAVDEAGSKRGENVNLLSSIIWAGNDFMQHGIQLKACDAIPELD